MKTCILKILFLILPIISFGQNLNDSILMSFYNKTLTYYFSDSITLPDQKKFGCLLVKIDIETSSLIKNRGPNKFLYFNDSTEKNKILSWPYRRNNGRSIYRINHKLIGRDTVDIIIGGWTIEEASRKKLFLGVWCGGTLGYIPEGRFIYNKASDKWIFTTSGEIMEQEILKFKATLRRNNSP
jgi:hypothetical protein